MKRFNFNHFIVFGLCFLILIFMFLPYVVVDYGYGTSAASGFEIIFSSMNGALSFAYFLQYLLPIFAMAGLTGFLKGKTRSITMVNIASFGVLIQIISMCSTLGSAVGAGLILALIFWIFILTFSIFDLLNLDVVAKIKAASWSCVPPVARPSRARPAFAPTAAPRFRRLCSSRCISSPSTSSRCSPQRLPPL